MGIQRMKFDTGGRLLKRSTLLCILNLACSSYPGKLSWFRLFFPEVCVFVRRNAMRFWKCKKWCVPFKLEFNLLILKNAMAPTVEQLLRNFAWWPPRVNPGDPKGGILTLWIHNYENGRKGKRKRVSRLLKSRAGNIDVDICSGTLSSITCAPFSRLLLEAVTYYLPSVDNRSS